MVSVTGVSRRQAPRASAARAYEDVVRQRRSTTPPAAAASASLRPSTRLDRSEVVSAARAAPNGAFASTPAPTS
jgi:hypothetical protein